MPETPKPEKQKVNFVTFLNLVWSHKAIFAMIIGFVVSLSTGATWVYNHFAKQEDLVWQYCERQAIDADQATAILVSKHETMVLFSTTILSMFEEIGMESDPGTQAWIDEWEDIESKHRRVLTKLRRQQQYWNPVTIQECVNTPGHNITRESILGEIDAILEED